VLRRIIGVAVVSGLLFAGMAGPGLISGVPVAVADQGNAAVIEKVGSSLVYVRTRFMGRVKVTDAVGASWSELLVVNGQCSGYVVDPRGYIVTAGHCVDGDDDGIRTALRMKSVIDVARTLGKDSDWLRKKYAQAVAEKSVIGPEVMAPLRDAVRFVDGDQSGHALLEHLGKPRHRQPLRRDEEVVERARQVVDADLARILTLPARVDAFGPEPKRLELLDLVLDQREQGAYH
jgi:hypothetical protein